MIPGILEAILMSAVVGQTVDAPTPPPHNLEPPLTVTLAGPVAVVNQPDLELVLAITRNVPDEVPITVHFAFPDGVVEVGGAPDFIIADNENPVIVRRIHVRSTRRPASDIVVTVDARSARYGVHATAAYTFGRPAVVATHVPPGPALRGTDGAVIGRPVVLDRRRPGSSPR